MTMRGIDISNWQNGLNLESLNVDFAIMKATEGLHFVDSYCDGWVQQAKRKGICWGFYHFANNNDPIAEAEFFVRHTRNYFNDGVPVLDIEDSSIPNWGEYSDAFTNRVHELTGVYPLVYTSAGFLSRFAGYEAPENCGLWCAGYPYPSEVWTEDEFPYCPSPWAFVAIWQFTSSLRLDGFGGNLDGNIAYMDSEAWDKYAGKTRQASETPVCEESSQVAKTIEEVAHEVILGEWGVGLDRKRMLESQGFDYTEVQNYVNELYSISHRVIHGDYGNGEERIERLSLAGYNPNTVQYIVNSFLL